MGKSFFFDLFDSQSLFSLIFAVAFTGVWVGSVFLFGFSLPLFAGYVALVSLLIFITPGIGLSFLILSTFWFERWFTLQPILLGGEVYKIYPLDIFLVVTAFSLVFHQLFGQKKYRLLFTFSHLSLLVFGVVCLLYTLFSLTNTQADGALVVSAFKNYAFYALLFFLVTWSVQSEQEIKRLLAVLVTGGLGVLLFFAIGVVRGEGLWTEFTPLSTPGTRLLAFPHALYASLALLTIFALVVKEKLPARLWTAVMWLLGLAILSSLMRHLWISVLVVFCGMLLFLSQQEKRAMAKTVGKSLGFGMLFLLMWVFVVALFPFSDFSRFSQSLWEPLFSRAGSLAQTAKDSSAQWRFFAWRAALGSMREHAFLGVGYGQDLTVVFDQYQRTVAIRELHNSYLVMLVQMGIVGASAFFVFLFSIGSLVLQALRGIHTVWLFAVLPAFALFLVAAFWQPYFETNLIGMFLWILAGLAVSASQWALRENKGEI